LPHRKSNVLIDDILCGSIPSIIYKERWVTVFCDQPLQGKKVKLEGTTDYHHQYCGIKVFGYQNGVNSNDTPGYLKSIDVSHTGTPYTVNK
jgi:hypothetical protein